MRKTKYFGVIVLLICLLFIVGCSANTNVSNTPDEVVTKIISSNTEDVKGNTYKFTGEVTYLNPQKHDFFIDTNTKCNSSENYFLSVYLAADDKNYDKLKKGSVVTVKADLDYYKKGNSAILMKNGSIIEVDGEKLEESETVSSEIQSSNNDESSKEEQSKLLEKSRLKEESRLLEQSKAEQSRLLEESRLQEESRLLEESKLQEQSRLLEQSRLREESRLREQSKAQQMQEFTFILNTDSKVYHLYECSAAKRMKSDKKRYVTKTAATKSEAMRQIEADGYHVCGICTR